MASKTYKGSPKDAPWSVRKLGSHAFTLGTASSNVATWLPKWWWYGASYINLSGDKLRFRLWTTINGTGLRETILLGFRPFDAASPASSFAIFDYLLIQPIPGGVNGKDKKQVA